MQRPLLAPEQLQATRQPFAGSLFVKAIELTFMGVHPAHEPVPRRLRRGLEIGVVAAVQHQFVTTLQTNVPTPPEPKKPEPATKQPLVSATATAASPLSSRAASNRRQSETKVSLERP